MYFDDKPDCLEYTALKFELGVRVKAGQGDQDIPVLYISADPSSQPILATFIQSWGRTLPVHSEYQIGLAV